jgi:hypothetical protein
MLVMMRVPRFECFLDGLTALGALVWLRLSFQGSSPVNV